MAHVTSTPTALLFPGQGSHAEGMDAPWRGHEVFERGLEILGYDPFERLEQGTGFQQPALFLCSVASWCDEAPEAPVAAAGHSLGEYAALVAAGAIAFEDGVRLVSARAAAMERASRLREGAMVALLGGDPVRVAELARRLGLVVANDNAPGQVVLAGPAEAIAAAEEHARDDAGARARRLNVAGAFHSPLMAPAADALRTALQATPVAAPSFPVFSNGTAAPFTDVRRELVENLLRPVRWRETLLAMRAAGVRQFAELGPGAVLTGLVRRTLAEAA